MIRDDRKRGFTLIELSIVLVIIGLVAGGVLVGRDLIAAAESRAVVSQVEKFNTEAHTFQEKYNGLPGDLARPASAGVFSDGMTGAPGLGDGNGLIEGGAAGMNAAAGETLAFWRHLSDANLIGGAYGINGNSALGPGGVPVGVVTDASQSFPPSKLGKGMFFTTYVDKGLNFFSLTTITGINAVLPYYVFGSGGIEPAMAYGIDAKMDDGIPQTGTVQSRAPDSINALSVLTLGFCDMFGNCGTRYGCDIIKGGIRVYDVKGNQGTCGLAFRFN